MSLNKDELSKGKDDWMNYQQKRNQIKEDRVADKEHNEEIAKKQAAKKEKRKIKEPGSGFHLG